MIDYLSKFKKLDLKTKKMISGNLAGNFKSAFKGRGLEFDEFKEYDSGDDSKYIDWLVSAREQRLLTKRFAIDKSIKVFFVLDITKTMEFGFEKTKIDTLIESFFLLALSSIENGDDVGAVVFNENSYSFFDAKKGKASVFEIYRKIEEMSIGENEKKDTKTQGKLDSKGLQEKSIISIFSFLNKIRLKNTFLFILTDKMNVKDDKNLKILALKNDVVFVNIFDEFENTLETLAENSGVLGFISNLGKRFFIDNLNEKKKEEYRELRKNKINDLSKYLVNLKISYLKLDNKSNIYKEFFNLFAKK